jgi:hypothetical protein
MKVEQLIILQILAHLLTDYTFQTDKKAKEKNKKGFKSKFLKWHVFLAFSFSWILSFQLNFIYGALAIALSHWLIDGIKVYINRSRHLGKYAYFIDQALHLVVIIIVVLLFDHYFILKPLINITLSTKYLAILAVFIFCTKPANILIKEIFQVFNISFQNNVLQNTDLPNAGKLIGIIERWLVLIFVLLNQFEAIGFLIAAKSILRYKDNETLKTEYVLIGTMLSFAIAIVSGIIVNLL